MTGIMDFSPSEHHELLRKSVRDFARTEVLPHAKKWDEEERFPKEIVPKLAALGLLGIRIPEEYGGSGMDVTSTGPPREPGRCSVRSTFRRARRTGFAES